MPESDSDLEASSLEEAELEYELATDGPPAGLSRRGRWAKAHFVVQSAAPGEWVVFKGLSSREASSLRTAIKAKAEEAVSRQQEDGTLHLWVLRCAATANTGTGTESRDAAVTPPGVTTGVTASIQ